MKYKESYVKHRYFSFLLWFHNISCLGQLKYPYSCPLSENLCSKMLSGTCLHTK